MCSVAIDDGTTVVLICGSASLNQLCISTTFTITACNQPAVFYHIARFSAHLGCFALISQALLHAGLAL